MKNNQLLREKKDIIAWLEKYEVTNYELIEDSVYAYVVDVNGSVNISHKKLNFIAVKFDTVCGDFYCYNNQLTTLEGAPKEVGDDFYCYNNQLVSLKYSPKKVSGDYNCDNNQLTSLEGCSKKIGKNFSCHNNQLESLEGCPKKVGRHFFCDNNQLQSLELKNLPEIIGGKIYLGNNPLLGQFQDINDLSEMKSILTIQEEQKLLDYTINCDTMNSNILKL